MFKSDVKVVPFNLQFFADESGNQNQSGSENQNGCEQGNGSENNGAQNQNGSQGERTFTQEEVSRMMTREKQQGKQSVLNALGFKTEDEAKSAFNLLKALQDSQKSEADKKEEEKNTAIQGKTDAEKRAKLAEAKLSCVVSGVDKDCVDDVLVIAMSKVSDDKTLDDVLSDMKKDARYSSFFTQSSGGNTGKTPQSGGSGTGSGSESDYGKRLAEQYGSQTGTNTKSKFF